MEYGAATRVWQRQMDGIQALIQAGSLIETAGGAHDDARGGGLPLLQPGTDLPRLTSTAAYRRAYEHVCARATSDACEHFIRSSPVPPQLVLKLHGDSGTVVQNAAFEGLNQVLPIAHGVWLVPSPSENGLSHTQATYDAKLKAANVDTLLAFLARYGCACDHLQYDAPVDDGAGCGTIHDATHDPPRPYVRLEVKTSEITSSSLKGGARCNMHISRIHEDRFSLIIAVLRGAEHAHMFIADTRRIGQYLTRCGDRGKEMRIFSPDTGRAFTEADILRQLGERCAWLCSMAY